MAEVKERMDFLDILKGIACVWMIHRHVWNALFDPKESYPSYYPNFMQGLAAPCFLIGAGFIFTMLFDSAKKKNAVSRRMQRMLYRCGQVALLGYALQLPYFSLRKTMFYLNHDEIIYFFHANILQCIGVSLALCAIFIWLLKGINTIIAGYIAGAMGLIMMLVSYWVWEYANLPVYVQSYFTFKQFSIFPLFPFGGILFFGAAAGSFYMQMKARNKVTLCFIIFIILGILFMLTRGWTFINQPFFSLGAANPFIYLYKTGQGLLALGVSYFLQKLTGPIKRIIDYLTLMGKEALFVYAFHLSLVYGCPLNKGLYSSFGGQLNYPEVMLLGLAILLITLIFTWLWSLFKQKWLLGVRILIALAFLIFIIKPW